MAMCLKMNGSSQSLECPICKKAVQWTQAFPFRPFCSQRCKLIDLGEWASESYRFPEKTPSDDPSPKE